MCKPLGLMSHKIAYVPPEAAEDLRTWCVLCPWPGPGDLWATRRLCLAQPQQVHFAALRASPGASTGLLIISLCQTFVSNFIPKEVVYFPFGSVCDSYTPVLKVKQTKKKARDANELFTFYSSPLPQRFNKLSSLCAWTPRCLSGLNIFKGPETPSLWFKLLLITLQILVYFSTSGGI